MIIYADGQISGTVGGGEMEHRVKLEAANALADGKPRLVSYSLVNPSDGDPGVCGGEADIFLEPYMPDPKLFVIGAGHVGKAVGELGHWLGFRTLVWDDRQELIDELTGSDQVDAADSGRLDAFFEAQAVTANDSIVVVTRNVALDLEIMPLVLATSASYVGLMGSDRRWATTRSALSEAGLESASLERVQAPIGVEIAAETPEEIAVSILAAVIASRRSPA